MKRVTVTLIALAVLGLAQVPREASAATAGNAQLAGNVIQGVVKDAKTGEVLPGANVVLEPVSGRGERTGAASGLDGKFVIAEVSPGIYRLRVSYIGYVPHEQADFVVVSGESRTLTIALEPTGITVNPISITASRRPEKALDAPASITVLEAQQIEARSTFTAVDHLKGMPGVDVASSGLVSSNMTIRGFNDIFSTSLMVLTDNRIARVPNLRLNAYSMIPSTNEDIERIELVAGPGSALYGPNSANGVLHILTKSPFGSEGTTVSVAGGERDVFLGSFRHANSFGGKWGYKISGQYYRGNDWQYLDPGEPAKIQLGRQTASGRIAVGDSIANTRNFNVEKMAVEARADFRLSNDATLILNGGYNQIDQIELTGIGAAQARNWAYIYGQARFTYKDLFLQTFMNMSDAGDTYLLRSGDLIVDNSKLFVGQVQHGFNLGNRQRFTYGIDALFTRPNTKGTINGRNEENDDINEFGAYLQSETTLSPKLDFVTAARFDTHSRLEGVQFSPRAAVVFKPTPAHTFRATYNRAFRTPENNSLFLDILSAPDAFGLGALLEPALGFRPATDVRAQGVPETGFHFRRTAGGLLQYRSSFAPLAGLAPTAFIDLNDEDFNNAIWSVARGLVFQGLQDQFRSALLEQGFSDVFINQLFGKFEQEILPQHIPGVKNVLAALNPDPEAAEAFTPATDVVDIPRQKPTITQTFEAGYKGVFGNRLVVDAAVYYTKLNDFGGPLLVETPSVFFDPATLAQSLETQFAQNYNSSTNFLLRGILLQLDDPENDGNGNGTPVDELTAIFTENAAGIPFGTVTPQEALDPTAVMLTYRNFGDINVWGAEFSFTYYLNENWHLSANYSHVSEDLFPESADQPHEIALNAPKNKAGASVSFQHPGRGLDAQLRFRWVQSFPVNTGVYVGRVGDYAVLDFNFGYRILHHTKVSLTVQNLTDNKHQEMVGAPELGRLAMLRVSQSF